MQKMANDVIYAVGIIELFLRAQVRRWESSSAGYIQKIDQLRFDPVAFNFFVKIKKERNVKYRAISKRCTAKQIKNDGVSVKKVCWVNKSGDSSKW